MTDEEFDILNELYFLISFKELGDSCSLNSEKLKIILWNMIIKGWVNCFKNYDQEIVPTKEEFEYQFINYHYLASKKGLLAHNAR